MAERLIKSVMLFPWFVLTEKRPVWYRRNGDTTFVYILLWTKYHCCHIAAIAPAPNADTCLIEKWKMDQQVSVLLFIWWRCKLPTATSQNEHVHTKNADESDEGGERERGRKTILSLFCGNEKNFQRHQLATWRLGNLYLAIKTIIPTMMSAKLFDYPLNHYYFYDILFSFIR